MPFQKVIRHAWIGTRYAIENIFERQFGIFTTRFAAGKHPLCRPESCGIDENDVLLFGSGVKKISHSCTLSQDIKTAARSVG
jgi:hypothetical protein